MNPELQALAQMLQLGNSAKGNLAGLDEQYATADALRTRGNTKANKYGYDSPFQALADNAGRAQGHIKARELAPQRVAARADVAKAASALPMYKLQQEQNAIDLTAANRNEDLDLAANTLEYDRGLAKAKVVEDARKADRTAKIAQQQADTAANRGVTVGTGSDLVDPITGKVRFAGRNKVPVVTKAQAKLKEDEPARLASIDKAAKLLQAYNSDAESGTSRTALGWIPGQFTDQAAFDQEVDAFAELAARARLKAMGEIRPTDTDVAGVKDSLFGKGKGEQVNINLLTEYLEEQLTVENEARTLDGREPMAFPDVSKIEGDWYKELFGAKDPATSAGLEFDDAEEEAAYQAFKAAQAKK